MKKYALLTPKVLVTRTVPQSRALSDNFWFVANDKVYECKNLRLSEVLVSINWLSLFEVNNESIYSYCATGVNPNDNNLPSMCCKAVMQSIGLFRQCQSRTTASGEQPCCQTFAAACLCRRGPKCPLAPPAGVGAAIQSTQTRVRAREVGGCSLLWGGQSHYFSVFGQTLNFSGRRQQPKLQKYFF